MLTDEDDCSFTDYCAYAGGTPGCRWLNNNICYDEIPNAIPVSSFVSTFGGIKASTAGIRKVRAALIAGGVLATQGENQSFETSGCYIAGNNQPSAACGCWSATDETYFCSYLQQRYGHPCAEAGQPPLCFPAGNTLGTHCASTANGACDTPRCEALPGGRYVDFLNDLGAARREVGFPSGTYVDSICQPSYSTTLLNIARTVVLSTCFTLEQAVLDPTGVVLKLRHTDPNTGAVTERDLPRFDGVDPTADCDSCADQACLGGAWQLTSDNKEICLTCGLKKDTGDDYTLTVLNEVVGFDGGPP
jgi:hypothetical protein